MAMKYRRSLAELKHILEENGICGSWEREPHGVHLMRTHDGANLHWASGSKSLWIDGRQPVRGALAMAVAAILHRLDDDDG